MMPTDFAGAASTLCGKAQSPVPKNVVRINKAWPPDPQRNRKLLVILVSSTAICVAESELPRRISRVLSFRLQHFALGFPLRLRVLLHCLLLFLVRFLGSARFGHSAGAR